MRVTAPRPLRVRLVLVAVAALCAGSAGCAGPPNHHENARDWLPGVLGSLAGSWQDEESPEFVLDVEGSQILIADNERILDASTILRPIKGGFLVCREGYEAQLLIQRAGEHVELFDVREARRRRLVKLDSKPATLSLSLPLPDPVPLPEERILAIQREVRRRFQADQSLFRQRARGREEPPSWLEGSSRDLPSGVLPDGLNFHAIDLFGTNSEFMRNLVQEIGWVDARRFGYPASLDAFILVQHSRDLPLILSVLPRIEQDVDAGLMDGGSYALLFDRAQLMLGRRQRFGSQVAKTPSGEWIVLPLEEPEGVDARRREWGLPPLKDYVGIFGASVVKLSTECSALSSPRSPAF